jgi:hypothetical protein
MMKTPADEKEVAIIVLSRKNIPENMSLEEVKKDLLEKLKNPFQGWKVESVQVGRI